MVKNIRQMKQKIDFFYNEKKNYEKINSFFDFRKCSCIHSRQERYRVI